MMDDMIEVFLNPQKCDNASLRTLMNELLLLYQLDCIKRQSGEYMRCNLINGSGYAKLDDKFNELCKKVGNNAGTYEIYIIFCYSRLV